MNDMMLGVFLGFLLGLRVGVAICDKKEEKCQEKK